MIRVFKPSTWPPALDLCLSGVIYGFGFVATKWALEDWSPLAVTFLRFVLAAAVGYGALVLLPSLRKANRTRDFSMAFLPGFILGLEFLFLTKGLMLTSITNSAFIASLYVLMVPVLESVFMRTKPPRRHAVFVIMALMGVALLSHVDAFSSLSLGDLFCLICAVCTALHVLSVQRVASRIEEPFVFNLHQCVWASLFVGAAILIEQEPLRFHLAWKPGIGLLYLAVGSTLIAIMLQIRGQKKLGASVASLLFLLDAPFSTFFGMVLLSESITLDQTVGAFLILSASAAEIYFNGFHKIRRVKSNSKTEMDRAS